MLTHCTSCLVLIFCSIHANCEDVSGKRPPADLLAHSNVIATSYIYQQYGDGPAQLFYLGKHEPINGILFPPKNFSVANQSETEQVRLRPTVARPEEKMGPPPLREKPNSVEDVASPNFPHSVAKLIVELHSPQLPEGKPHRLKIKLPPPKPMHTNAMEESVEDGPVLNYIEEKPKVIKENPAQPKGSPFPKAEIVEFSLYKDPEMAKNASRPNHSQAYSVAPYAIKKPPEKYLTAPPLVIRPFDSPQQYNLYLTAPRPPPVAYNYGPPRKPRPKHHRPHEMQFYATMHRIPAHVLKAMQHFSRPYKPPPPPLPIVSHPNRSHTKKSQSESEVASSEKESKHKSSKKKHSKDDTNESDGSESVEMSHKHGQKSDKNDEKGSYEASEKGFEKSGGSKYNEEKHKKKGFADSKEYKNFDSFGKGKKGHYDEEDYYEFDDAEYGKKASNSKAADQHGQKHATNKGEKSGKFDEKKTHKKGSKTTGYHNVFHKDEYKKVHTFYDDADHRGKFKKYGSDHSQHESRAGAAKSNGHQQSRNDEHDEGVSRKTKNGSHSAEDTGYRKTHGNDRHHSDEENYSRKGRNRHRHERGRELEDEDY